MEPLLFRLRQRRRISPRREVPVPDDVGSTSAVFLALRRMRAPLLLLVVTFTLAVAGLSAAPPPDGQQRLSVFESFYVMSYTATTIGFGEIPYSFSVEQRLWVTLMIYATVVGWAYAVGTTLALLQDDGFRTAWGHQQIRRRVRRTAEPFHIVAGYGEAGRSVCRRLDALGRPFVVVDRDQRKVDLLEASDLTMDIAGIAGDVSDPAVLGLAGLEHPRCQGVLALTDDDLANLAVVEAVTMLQPEVAVISRVQSEHIEELMDEFSPAAVINPIDRSGDYLVLALQRPAVFRLAHWLMSTDGAPVPPLREAVTSGTWAILAEPEFADEVGRDLEAGGFEVRRLTTKAPVRPEDLEDCVGAVVGTGNDATNLALAARIRRDHPDLRLVVRQVQVSSHPLLEAFDPYEVFVATELVAEESLARIVTPRTWAFLEHVMEQDDAWADRFTHQVQRQCGQGSPVPHVLRIDEREAPALTAWLAGGRGFTVGDLVRDPDDRDDRVPAWVLSLARADEVVHDPSADTPLRPGDELLVLCGPGGLARLRQALFTDSVTEYVSTGRHVPSTWIWRRLARR